MSRRSNRSGGHWRRNQSADAYVQRARAEGWRSRAVFKLEEIDRRERLIRPGMTIVDLGAAPGGWSQYAAQKLKGNGRIIALDLLEIAPLDQVEFIHGDFTEDAVLNQLMTSLGEQKADLVMSDMAPNISGMKAVDQPRSMLLAELARDLALDVLRVGGGLVIKLFQGEGFDEFVRETRASF
ncbi:MAG: 23S rRNA methyltransferase, partial [Gammaproteobacteria bacterium]|nr:23S rRNA methyltransferase [Gammaproteobacteria bacterium]